MAKKKKPDNAATAKQAIDALMSERYSLTDIGAGLGARGCITSIAHLSRIHTGTDGRTCKVELADALVALQKELCVKKAG